MNAEESVELEQLMFVEEPMDGDEPRVHPAWLPPEAFRSLGARRVLLHGEGLLVDTVLDEVSRACARYGGRVWHSPSWDVDVDLVLALRDGGELPNPAVEAARAAGEAALVELGDGGTLGDEGFVLARAGGVTAVLADAPAGLLYGLFHVVRLGEAAFAGADRRRARTGPRCGARMLDHWDNVAVHPVMGQVERGYAGGSLFWQDGAAARRPGPGPGVRPAAGRLRGQRGRRSTTSTCTRPRRSCSPTGSATSPRIADAFRPYGIRLHLSVSFAAPVVLGGLPTADPLDEAVRAWWAAAAAAGVRGDPGLRRVRGEGRLGGAAGPVRVRPQPRRRGEHAGRGARAARRRRALAGVRLQPPAGLAGPVDGPGPGRVRPFRAAGRAVRGQRGRCR